MSYKSDLIYKIAISRIKGVGDITAKKLISLCGSANLVFKENKKSFLWDEDLKLINVLNTESLHLDELKKKLNWDSSKVAKHLLQMEFENLIVSLPGKIYKRRM